VELTEHLVHGVQWTASVKRMAEAGVTDFVEVGPGRVLSGLIRRISPEVTTHTVDGPDLAEMLRVLRTEQA
jgi:[acyl-carrier-protein] S-malonyltransferase